MLSDMYQELAVIEQRQPPVHKNPAQGRRWWSEGWGEKMRTQKLTLESCAKATSADTVRGSSPENR